MANIDWQLAGSIIFTGLAVVFAVLIILWITILIMGNIMKNFGEKPTTVTPQTATVSVSEVKTTLSDVEVAVITAAAAQIVKENFTIKEISLHNTGKLVWKAD